MRISDWSSDVGSSDLRPACGGGLVGGALRRPAPAGVPGHRRLTRDRTTPHHTVRERPAPRGDRVSRSPCSQHARQGGADHGEHRRSEEHTSELQSLMRISYAVFCLKKKKKNTDTKYQTQTT